MNPTSHPNAFKCYQRNKAPLNYDARDFCDKYVMLTSSDGAFYCYQSSLPDSEEFKAVPEKTVRADTLISVQKMDKLEDGSILYQMMS